MKGLALSITSPEDPRYDACLRRLKMVKRINATVPHMCSRQCNPQSEVHLVSSGLLAPPALSDNLFLCSLGNVHLCTEDHCQLYDGDESCPVSGIQYGRTFSSYTRGDARTWNTEEHDEWTAQSDTVAVVAKNKAPQQEEEMVRERALNIVTALLWSRTRQELNAAAISKRVADARTELIKYTAQQFKDGQLPFFTVEYQISAHIQAQPLPFVIFRLDEELRRYYVEIIYQIWTRVLKHYDAPQKRLRSGGTIVYTQPRLNCDVICVAALYMMREGLRFGDLEVVPRDEFLAAHLPRISDMNHFGIEKSSITVGDKIITDAYESALQKAIVNRQSLELDLPRLAQIRKAATTTILVSSTRQVFMRSNLNNP